MKKTLKAIKITAVVLATTAIMTACSAKGSIKEGSWDNNTFTNEWSGITFEMPEGYTASTAEELEAVQKTGEEIAVNNGNNAAAVDLATLRTFYDFMLASDDDMSNVTLMYENLSFTAGMANFSIEDYYKSLKEELLATAGMDYAEISKTTVNVAGEDFTKGSYSLYAGQLFQDYYIRKLDGAVIALIVTYTEDYREAIDNFIASIKKYESA